MKNTFFITWIFLVLITLTTTILANSGFQYVIETIMGLAYLKFIGVAFYFMELKGANLFWKISVATSLFVFVITIILMA